MPMRMINDREASRAAQGRSKRMTNDREASRAMGEALMD